MENTERLHELTARLEAHVARCEERDKTIFNDLAELKQELKDFRMLMTTIGVLLTSGVAGTLVTVLLRG
jgi:hypothetical protein|tara:strand:+ start:2096 stop:2302 length:207 start_codon:yes stop_codon:yes gene_type:complete